MTDGERDLNAILASMTIARREGTFVYVSLAPGSVGEAAATITEDEGTTFVVERATAERLGLPWSFAAAWLTVSVHTSLDAVGVTAALAATLATAAIPCNVLAGFYHDHLLVPIDRVDDAISTLESLQHRASPSTS